MKASVKLRDAEGHGPLLRAKLPISAFGLPLVSSASVGGGPGDLSLQLRTAFPWGPSLALSYNPLTQPFSLSIKSGLGRYGSPLASPLLLSARLSLSPNSSSSSSAALSFSLQLKPSLGHFSLKKSAASPNTGSNKEDGGGAGLEEFLTSGVAVAVRSTMPVGRRTAVRLRWGANVPPRGAAVGRRLPYLTVEKISVEYVGNGGEEGSQKTGREREEGNVEEVNGMLHSMGREVELQKDDSTIKENVELLGKKVGDGRDRRIEGSGAKLESIGSRGIKQDGWKGVGGSGRQTC